LILFNLIYISNGLVKGLFSKLTSFAGVTFNLIMED
jgi:hypothetical protein